MPEPMGNKGDGDNHIQAYNYRLTLTKTKPFRPITAQVPDNYDPSKYELLFRWMAKKGWSGYGDCGMPTRPTTTITARFRLI